MYVLDPDVRLPEVREPFVHRAVTFRPWDYLSWIDWRYAAKNGRLYSYRQKSFKYDDRKGIYPDLVGIF